MRCPARLGAINQDTVDAVVAAIAQVQGSPAVGAGGVTVFGDNDATINLGVIIQQEQA